MTKYPSKEDQIKQSITDLKEDCQTLIYLTKAQTAQIRQFSKDIRHVQAKIGPILTDATLKQSDHILRLVGLRQEAVKAIAESLDRLTTFQGLASANRGLRHLQGLIRINQSLAAGLITSTDWQSPSFMHSRYSQAGRQTGQIVGTISDYKRDHHKDAQGLEKQFRKEYIDGLGKSLATVLVTQSGMAALTTIINFILIEADPDRPILLGQHSYFENKFLLEPIFGKRIVTVNEADTKAVLAAIKEHQPAAIFLDSLCNVAQIVVPDLPTIVTGLKKYSTKQTYLIIDNTGLATSFQPLQQIAGKTTKVSLIVFESLNKYYQFGMDKTTGGVIWGFGKSVSQLHFIRMHSGTIMTDVATQLAPPPNRKRLTKRLHRFERNALLLAQLLSDSIANNPASPLAKVVYPGLPNHHGFSWTNKLPFHGSFFVLGFKKPYAKVPIYQKLLKVIRSEAQKRNIDIIAGTSFGFDTTRVYLTALQTDITEPFFRVSVGTEPLWQISILYDVFIAALKRIS